MEDQCARWLGRNGVAKILYKKGDSVIHTAFGRGTVIDDSSGGRVEVEFFGCGRKLLDLEYANLELIGTEGSAGENRNEEKWRKRQSETFVCEELGRHFMGSHWEPFYSEIGTLFEKLPHIIPNALEMESYTSLQSRKPPFDVPSDWPVARYLSWPLRERGLLAAVNIREDANELVSIFPFAGFGVEHTVDLDRVFVWENGVEAQIVASLGDAEICFFDALYAENRAWYLSGETYQFILAGIAYDCRSAEDHKIVLKESSPLVEILKEEAEREGRAPHEEPPVIHTQGMAMLIPVTEWDRDDYRFHGSVRKFEEIDMLEQTAWRVRTTVLRSLGDDSDINLDIVVTRNIWGDTEGPKVGQDIEGTLWLQGYLWSPPHLGSE